MEQNAYFVCLPGESKPQRWLPADRNDRPLPDLDYYGAVCSALERDCGGRGLTIYITWNVSCLPTYGENVVAIVLGDEWARYPAYASRVRAVFKCYGLSRALPAALRPSVASALAYAQEGRAALMSVTHVFYRLRDRLRRCPMNVWDLPLGYYKQLDMPLVPIAERPYDVFFAGSTTQNEPRGVLARFRQQPKELARRTMLTTLAAYARTNPKRRVELRTTADFHASVAADTREYSEALMASKICVVPRGTSLETFRWFEGMRYGCAVICEALPKRRYYEKSPAIRIEDWREAGTVIDRLLDDPAELERRSALSLRWWNERCSAAVTAAFIARRLEATR